MRRIGYLLLMCCAFSCTTNENDLFPFASVNLELDLTYEDKALKESMAYKTYIMGQTTGLSAVERTGFGGVIVYHDLYGYSAYDLACPYEMKYAIRVEIDESRFKAVCPSCGSEFGIYENGGAVLKGPATQGLKRYNTHQSGNKIYVTN